MILGVLTAVAGLALIVSQPSPAGSLASVGVVDRTVEISPDGGDGFREARGGDSLEEGSRVRTDESGFAELSYADGSVSRIGPDTEYQLTRLRTDQNSRDIVGSLKVGQTFHRVSKVTGSGSRFEVQTSKAVAAVRGTEFAVQCVIADICEVGVVEGRVAVLTPDGKTVEVPAGRKVVVDGSGDLSELLFISQSDPWIEKNKELDSAPAPSSEESTEVAAAPIERAEPIPDEDDADEGSTTSAATTTTPTTGPPQGGSSEEPSGDDAPSGVPVPSSCSRTGGFLDDWRATTTSGRDHLDDEPTELHYWTDYNLHHCSTTSTTGHDDHARRNNSGVDEGGTSSSSSSSTRQLELDPTRRPAPRSRTSVRQLCMPGRTGALRRRVRADLPRRDRARRRRLPHGMQGRGGPETTTVNARSCATTDSRSHRRASACPSARPTEERVDGSASWHCEDGFEDVGGRVRVRRRRVRQAVRVRLHARPSAGRLRARAVAASSRFERSNATASASPDRGPNALQLCDDEEHLPTRNTCAARTAIASDTCEPICEPQQGLRWVR